MSNQQAFQLLLSPISVFANISMTIVTIVTTKKTKTADIIRLINLDVASFIPLSSDDITALVISIAPINIKIIGTAIFRVLKAMRFTNTNIGFNSFGHSP